MTPEEEFEQGQREGRAREREKTLHRITSWGAAMIVGFGIFVPLVWFELAIIRAVPLLAVLGRVIFFVFAMMAAAAAAFVWRHTGGNRLKEIEAWERKRDDL